MKCSWFQYSMTVLPETTVAPQKGERGREREQAPDRLASAARRPDDHGGTERAEIDHRLVGGDAEQAERQQQRAVAPARAVAGERDGEDRGHRGIGDVVFADDEEAVGR